AELRERTAAGFLPKEVLVYLIREAKRVDDQATITELFTILERRCEATLASAVPDSYQSGCLDERPVVLREDARRGQPMAPGKLTRTDYEYVRCGTANIFCIVEPLTGRRLTFATANRKAPAFVRALRKVAQRYRTARRIHLVMDNLNVHSRTSVVTVLGELEGHRLWRRFVVHYTPKHASWLDAAELEASLVSRGCLGGRRVSSLVDLISLVAAWRRRAEEEHRVIDWRFQIGRAHV